MESNQKAINCFFCGVDLSNAQKVNYVAEGPVCTLCLSKGNNEKSKKEDDEFKEYDQVLYG